MSYDHHTKPSFFTYENAKIYFMDLVEIFNLIVNSDAVQYMYKTYVTDVFDELEENLLDK